MKITYRIHAIQRMFERSVSAEDMRFVLQRGKARYPDRVIFLRIATGAKKRICIFGI